MQGKAAGGWGIWKGPHSDDKSLKGLQGPSSRWEVGMWLVRLMVAVEERDMI